MEPNRIKVSRNQGYLSQKKSQVPCQFQRKDTPPKTNMDTQNDGLEKVTPASNMAMFGINSLNFWVGIPSLKLTFSPPKMDGFNMIVSFWDCLFSRAMLNFWGVYHTIL